MKLDRIFRLLSFTILLSACATTVPISSRMNDAIMMNIKQGATKVVAFEFDPRILDGELQPVGKDSREAPPMSPTFSHTESTTLNKMLKDYLGLKFASVNPDASAKLKVTLNDFWIEQYNTTGTGKQFMVAMVGGEMNIAIVAHLTLTFEYSNGGAPITKNLMIEADSMHVQGVGTYSGTSAYHRGRDSIEFRVAEAIDGANNKAIAMLNSFLDSIQ